MKTKKYFKIRKKQYLNKKLYLETQNFGKKTLNTYIILLTAKIYYIVNRCSAINEHLSYTWSR